MAFSKTPTKVTTIKEYGTNVPDSVYPTNSKTTQSNTSNTGTYIPTTGRYTNNSTDDEPVNQDPIPSVQGYTPTTKSSWSNKLQTLGAIFAILIPLGGGIWYLSKIDSKVDELAKDVEKSSTRIDDLKDKMTEIFLKVDNIGRNSQQNKKSK